MTAHIKSIWKILVKIVLVIEAGCGGMMIASTLITFTKHLTLLAWIAGIAITIGMIVYVFKEGLDKASYFFTVLKELIYVGATAFVIMTVGQIIGFLFF